MGVIYEQLPAYDINTNWQRISISLIETISHNEITTLLNQLNSHTHTATARSSGNGSSFSYWSVTSSTPSITPVIQASVTIGSLVSLSKVIDHRTESIKYSGHIHTFNGSPTTNNPSTPITNINDFTSTKHVATNNLSELRAQLVAMDQHTHYGCTCTCTCTCQCTCTCTCTCQCTCTNKCVAC